jgi:hypothetical protein
MFFQKPCCLRGNVKKYGTARQYTDENIIRRMHIACLITTAADRRELIILNTYCFPTTTMVTRTRLHITLYVPGRRVLLTQYKMFAVFKAPSAMQLHALHAIFRSVHTQSCHFLPHLAPQYSSTMFSSGSGGQRESV